MALYKTCARCGKMILQPYRYCDKCQTDYENEMTERKKQINKRYDETRDTKYIKFYKSKEWQMLKERKLMDVQYKCEECSKAKMVDKNYHERLATEVHHIETLKDNWNRRLDYTNLKALCHYHHDVAHHRFSGRKKVKK